MKRGCIILFLAVAMTKIFGQGPYPTSATLLWKLPLTSPVDFAPMIGVDGTIYFLDDGNTLRAVNANGTAKWQTNSMARDYQLSGSIGLDGLLYVPTSTGLAAVSPANGGTNWVFNPTVSMGPPAIGSNGVVYTAGYFEFDAVTNGVEAWSYQTLGADAFYGGGSGGSCEPVVGADGVVYVISYYGDLFAFNADGSVKWTIPSGYFDPQSGMALAADGTLYCLDNVNGSAYGLAAVNSDGNVNWVYTPTNVDADFAFTGSPVIGRDGTIYVEASGAISSSPVVLTNVLYAMSPGGSVEWKTPLSWASPAAGKDALQTQGAAACALASDGEIFAAASDGTVYSLAPNGTTNWTYQTGSSFLTAPVVGPKGTLYVASYNNPALYAFQAPPVACSPWPDYRKNARNAAAVDLTRLSAPLMGGKGFQFNITGTSNLPVCVGASSDLINWTNIGLVVLTNGAATDADAGAANYQSRFYQAFPQ